MQLDWGALLFPVTKEMLIELYAPTSRLRPHDADSDAERIQLSELPEND